MEDNVQTNNRFWRNKKFDWFDWFIVMVIFGLFMAIATYKSTRVTAGAITYDTLSGIVGLSEKSSSSGGYLGFDYVWYCPIGDTDWSGVVTVDDLTANENIKTIYFDYDDYQGTMTTLVWSGLKVYNIYTVTTGHTYRAKMTMYDGDQNVVFEQYEDVTFTLTPATAPQTEFGVTYRTNGSVPYFEVTTMNCSGTISWYMDSSFVGSWSFTQDSDRYHNCLYSEITDSSSHTFYCEYTYVRLDDNSVHSDTMTISSDAGVNYSPSEDFSSDSSNYTFNIKVTALSDGTYSVKITDLTYIGSGSKTSISNVTVSLGTSSTDTSYSAFSGAFTNPFTFTVPSSSYKYMKLYCVRYDSDGSVGGNVVSGYELTLPTYVAPVVATPTPIPSSDNDSSAGGSSSSSGSSSAYSPIVDEVINDNYYSYDFYMTNHLYVDDTEYISVLEPDDEWSLRSLLTSYGLPSDYTSDNCYFVIYSPLESNRIYCTLCPRSNSIDNTYLRPYLVCDSIGSYRPSTFIFAMSFNDINQANASDSYGSYHTSVTSYSYAFNPDTLTWDSCNRPTINTHLYEDIIHISNTDLYGLDYCGMYNATPYCNYTGTYLKNSYLICNSNYEEIGLRDNYNWGDYLRRFNYSAVTSYGNDYIIYKIAPDKPYFMIVLRNGLFTNYHRTNNTIDFVCIDDDESVYVDCYFLTEYNYRVQKACTVERTQAQYSADNTVFHIGLYPSMWQYSSHNFYDIAIPCLDDDSVTCKPVFLYLSKLTVDYDAGTYSYASCNGVHSFYNCGDLNSLIGSGTDSYSLSFLSNNSNVFSYAYNLFDDIRFRIRNLGSRQPVISITVPSTSTSSILPAGTTISAIDFSWYSGTLRDTFYLFFSALIYFYVLKYVIKTLKNIVTNLGGGDHE